MFFELATILLLCILIYKYFTTSVIVDPVIENNKINLDLEVRSLSQKIGNFESLLFQKQSEVDLLNENNKVLQVQLSQAIEDNKIVLSQKKSAEVSTGNIVEILSPFFLEGHDRKKLRHLGMPIDYISFDLDGIYLIEIKSGNSRLSKNQKRIKQLVKEKKVFFKEFRISGKKLVKDDV
jgi:predicted Holliday junction resolvase-like endonuclease